MDSEEEAGDELEFETRTTDGDGEEDIDIDEDLLNGVEEVSEGDDDTGSDDSDTGSDDEDDDDDEPPVPTQPPQDIRVEEPATAPPDPAAPAGASQDSESRGPTPPPSRPRSLSPSDIRRKGLFAPIGTGPRSYTVEAICAIPHPVPTHALASSACMTHLLTGSDDGYIRDYDVFAAVNGKVFLSAPQRHHCGVVEGILKAGQIRSWWENPYVVKVDAATGLLEEPSVSSVYSLAMQSDALWALAGSDTGHINLFTVRHEPGRLVHVMNMHKGPVSGLALDHDQKGFFSAGWDGEAIQWDLNAGQKTRSFTAHGAQLTGIAVRPMSSSYYGEIPSPFGNSDNAYGSYPYNTSVQSGWSDARDFAHDAPTAGGAPPSAGNDADAKGAPGAVPAPAPQPAAVPVQDDEAKSDASFDPLFDDEPDADGEPDNEGSQQAGGFGGSIRRGSRHAGAPASDNQFAPSQTQSSQSASRGMVAPKNAPPLLDPETYSTFSADTLMTVHIDGQIILWDKRVHSPGKGVGRLWMSEKTPPWCLSACWSADGGQIYAGRRNGTVDIYDVRQTGRSGPGNSPRLLKTLRNPLSSGVVSCVVAFPDGRHVACASNDNIRLWNAAEAGEPDGTGRARSGVQFKIIPGHHGGYVSQMLIDPGARFLVSASSNRGWHGDSTRTVFVHDIKTIQ